jgi:hypothetical protein
VKFIENPYLIRSSITGLDINGNLTISFEAAGLGANETIKITCSANASVEYICRNKEGNFTDDHPNKKEVIGPVSVSASGKYTSGCNGQITDRLSILPPPSTLECLSGLTVALVRVTYTDIQVSIPGTKSESIPGIFIRTFFTL